MTDEKIKKTEEEWKKILNPEEFLICRKKGTEKPFSGQYHKNDSNGIYLCKCCNQKLFETKLITLLRRCLRLYCQQSEWWEWCN